MTELRSLSLPSILSIITKARQVLSEVFLTNMQSVRSGSAQPVSIPLVEPSEFLPLVYDVYVCVLRNVYLKDSLCAMHSMFGGWLVYVNDYVICGVDNTHMKSDWPS